jgi:subtilase-type serine protease
MAAAYAAMPLGDGFYVGGVVAAEASRTSLERMSTDGNAMLRLSGATKATRYTAVAEAGFETGIGNGLTLTPRAQLGYGHYTLSGFTEAGGETALKLDDVQVTRIEARLGAKLAGKTSIAGVTVVPQLSADYVSLLSGAKTGARVRFAVAPDHAFDLPLTDGSTAWAEIKGGVTFGDGPFTLGLSGQHATGNAMTDNRAQADVRFRF